MRFVRGTVYTALAVLCLYLMTVTRWTYQAQQPGHGRVVVTYWEKWTGNEAAQMQQIVDDFNNSVGKEKGIYVKYMSMTSVNQKTLVATAGGVPPDIAGLWGSQVAQFADTDALEPLDDLAAAHGITRDYYKPVYWNACHFRGHLYALVSTPAAYALHYNRQIFQERAAQLRAAGLDPNRPPATLQELDRYAKALDTYKTLPDGEKQIVSAGYLPSTDWGINYIVYQFGGKLYNEKTGRFTLNTPEMLKAMKWLRSYSERLGKGALTDFTSSLGQFDSSQNPFLTGAVVMEQQGPWMQNYIENLKPSMNRWHLPAGYDISKLSQKERADNCEWAVAPFPTAVPGLKGVSYCSFDTLMIPKGAKHRKEAFEFIAYVNRQDVMEKLTSLHSKNSPLRHSSQKYLETHRNPFISVFEDLASSPNAFSDPPSPIWPQAADELGNMVQRVYLLQATPEQALAYAQTRIDRAQEDYDRIAALRQHTVTPKAEKTQQP